VGIATLANGGVVSVCTRLREADQGLDVGEIERGLDERRYNEDEEQSKEASGELHDVRVTWEKAQGQQIGDRQVVCDFVEDADVGRKDNSSVPLCPCQTNKKPEERGN
jgi:hypothetical protein